MDPENFAHAVTDQPILRGKYILGQLDPVQNTEQNVFKITVTVLEYISIVSTISLTNYVFF